MLWSQQNVSVVTTAFDWSSNYWSAWGVGVVELQFTWPLWGVQSCHTSLMVDGEWQKSAWHLATCHLVIPTAEEGAVWCEDSQPIPCAQKLLFPFSFLRVFIYASIFYICVRRPVYVPVHMGTYKYGDPRLVSGIILDCPSTLHWDGVSQSNTEITNMASLSSQRFWGCSASITWS